MNILDDILTELKQLRIEVKELRDLSENKRKLLTRKEVAERLGISLVSVHRLMKSNVLPFTKILSKTYFKEEDVEKFLSQKL